MFEAITGLVKQIIWNAEYFWIDDNKGFCSIRVRLPVTNQLQELDVKGFPEFPVASDVVVKPRAVYAHPFKQGSNLLVLCSTFNKNNNPTTKNSRYICHRILSQLKEADLNGIFKRKFYLLDNKEQSPISVHSPMAQNIIEEYCHACRRVGLEVCITVGCELSDVTFLVEGMICIEKGDALCTAKYILEMYTKMAGLSVQFASKPRNLARIRSSKNASLWEVPPTWWPNLTNVYSEIVAEVICNEIQLDELIGSTSKLIAEVKNILGLHLVPRHRQIARGILRKLSDLLRGLQFGDIYANSLIINTYCDLKSQVGALLEIKNASR